MYQNILMLLQLVQTDFCFFLPTSTQRESKWCVDPSVAVELSLNCILSALCRSSQRSWVSERKKTTDRCLLTVGNICYCRGMAEPGPAPNHTSLQPRSDSHRGWRGEEEGVGAEDKGSLPWAAIKLEPPACLEM